MCQTSLRWWEPHWDVTYRLSRLQPHSQPAALTPSPLCRTPSPWTASLRIQGDRRSLSKRGKDASVLHFQIYATIECLCVGGGRGGGLQLTEMISITRHVHCMEEPLSQLPSTGPSLSLLIWMCRLLRQLAFTGCTLKRYWIPLLPRQHAPTNHSLWLEMLLLRGRLKACSALCGKS